MEYPQPINKIIDGNTFESAGLLYPVRLAGVDTPKKGEPGYSIALLALADLILKEWVRVEMVGSDRRGRHIANVYVGAKSVNDAMRKYNKGTCDTPPRKTGFLQRALGHFRNGGR